MENKRTPSARYSTKEIVAVEHLIARLGLGSGA
jgi:hypothetical protein